MRRRELSIRWTLRDTADASLMGPGYSASPIRGPCDLVKYLGPWAAEPQETIVVILFSTRMHILGHREIGRGSSTTCPMDIKEVFRAALMGGACAIILCHNHPSGSVNPSGEDLTITKRVRVAADLLGIPLLDHIIVGMNADGQLIHHSMKEHGQI